MKSKFKKIVMLAMVGIISTVNITGCSKTAEKSPKVSTIVSSIKKDFDIKTMKKSDMGKMKKVFGIEESKIDQYAYYIAPSFLKADQILIIKVKNESDIDAIKEKINKGLDKKENIFKSYLPEESSLIQKNVLDTEGKYILSVVSKKSDKIEKAFDKSFK